MSKTALIRMVNLPYCQAVMLEKWDAVPGRFFVAYRARANFNAILGQGVVDEFRTISGPILISSVTAIGSIYDAGMRLADARDLDAPIDQGWPPLTIGIDATAPARPNDWQDLFLNACKTEKSAGTPPWDTNESSTRVDAYQVESAICTIKEDIAARIIVTDAPMLPIQLDQLADVGGAAISIAVSVGNRLPRVSDGVFQQVDVVSEALLERVVDAAANSVS